MLSVRTSVAHIVAAAAGNPVKIECINSLKKTVVDGTTADLDALSVALATVGHRTFKMKIAHA